MKDAAKVQKNNDIHKGVCHFLSIFIKIFLLGPYMFTLLVE